MTNRKGIILAGGSGTRLYPITMGISKQLLPIYDKPMIYYPISTLMLAGIREIAIITTPHDQAQFQRLLGDGSQWGLSFEYIIQPAPDGLAQAYILAEDFLDGAPSVLVLGDNIFFGHGLPEILAHADAKPAGGTVFGYHVADPERYGVVGFDAQDRATSIIEKPEKPASNYAVTGLYFLDGTAPARAKQVKPSARGELEITTLLSSYLEEGSLTVERMGRGYAWLDTGTHASLLDAANFVRTLQTRQGLQVGSLEEIAYAAGWITHAQLQARAEIFSKNEYGAYLRNL
ncbi:MAG: glucose-1-phosphate thymidylyltransferase RfbA [Rhodobacteraceae bacterium]|nr:glucose-1-phosphate thymidylyltransferase RfbA [Paracoccaceae bacterium]